MTDVWSFTTKNVLSHEDGSMIGFATDDYGRGVTAWGDLSPQAFEDFKRDIVNGDLASVLMLW